ncbi:hypothetical protein PVAND_003138 [Polypedilum vanderplanki]|uniref:UDENN domain-containing protein n=1 Tax=Polypedilum vanderplanki TaxID=319348 RepID=A0A9J6BT61_POLVA|nr:hypothetical protein PVAND_003138 [Polypedilum vanderplanki]
MDSSWIHSIVIVDFEIEKGQVIENVFPEDTYFSETERNNLAYMAFPDSNSNCIGDTKFHISLRTNQKLSNQQRVYNRECKQELRADAGHYWGYVYFRQVKDSQSKRGYFQKSFVLMTRLPFHNFFSELVNRWAPVYFTNGISALEQGYNQIIAWPKLLATNAPFQLPFLGSVYQLYIPANISKIQTDTTTMPSQNEPDDVTNNNNNHNSSSSSSTIPISITSPNEIDIFGPIHTIIHHIQHIWELVLLAEPIVIIAPSPSDSSLMVQALTNLIAPLEYYPEVFPYFTIHNSEFREFASTTTPPAVILGCTNPYFAKTLANWPHTIRINESLQIEHPVPHRKLERVKSLQKLLMDSSGSIYSQHRPFLQKDKGFVKKILNGVKTRRPTAVQSIILRRYFLELTQSFIIPLERYMSSLMPLARDISAFRAPPVPAQFKEETFLGTLELSGPQLTSTVKGDYEGLYKRFFRSANFRGWYEARRMEQLQKLDELHQEALAKEDFKKWMRGKQEVEIIDMILSIKTKLFLPVNSNSTLTPPEPAISSTLKKETRDLLMEKLEDLIASLPDDLKTILN